MKLHLPKPLRNSVLACIAAVAGIATPTLGTATFAGGVVAFTLASQQAQAETASTWNTPYFGDNVLTWTGGAPDAAWNAAGNWVNSANEATAVERRDNRGPVMVFGDGVSVALDNHGHSIDTSDAGGIIVGENSVVTCSLGRWAGNVQVGEGSVLTTSFTQKQKTVFGEGYDPAAGSVFYIDGTLILNQTQANFDDGNGTRQFHIGEHGFIDFSKVTGMNVDGTMNLEVVVNRDGSIEGVKNRTLTETYLSREVMSSGMNLSGKFATVRLLAVTDTEGYDLLGSDSYTVEYTSAGVTVKYKGQGYASMTLQRGGDFTWSNYGDGWNVVGGDATDTTFINGDAVVFTSNGTATITGDVAVASMTLNENVAYSLALTENATLTVGSPDNRLTNFTTIPVNGETGTLSLYLSTNWQAAGDSRVILPESSTVGAVEVDGVFAYNLNNDLAAGISNLQGADLHLKEGSFWVIRNGITGGAVVDANIGDIHVDGNIDLYVYGSSNATIADAIVGSGTIDKFDGGTVTFTGGVSVTGLDVSGGTLNIACDASLAKLYAGTTLNLNGGTITTSQLRSGEQGASTINVNTGATLNVTGTNNNHATGNSFLLAHWGNGGTLNLNGGTINSAGAAIKTSWSGTGRFNAHSGEANVLGINFWAQSGFHGAFNLGAATSGDARVNLGSEGIKNYTGTAEVNLGCGTIGATADYTVAHNPVTGASNYVNLISGAGTVLDTLDAADKSTGRTVTFNVGLKGNGKLIKEGAGTLVLNSAALAASDGVEGFTGTVLLRGGNLQLANSGVIGGGSLLIGRGLTAAVTPTISGEELVSGTYALSQGTLGVQGGTGTATLGANLTLGGGALQFDTLSGDAAALDVTGALTLAENAKTTVLVSSVVGNSSQVKVLTAAGIDVSASSFELGGEITEMYTGTFAVADNTLTLTLSQRTDLLFWNSGSWNTSSQSWEKGGAAAVYTEGQNVFFTNDAADKTVSLAAGVVVSPGKMTITGTDYIITGEGTISGAGSMVVKENASVTVNTVNAYTGGTEIREGAVVSINNGSALGRPANYTDARVLGNISGTGTLVIDTTSDTEIAIKGNTAAAFTGTLHVKDGSLFLGQFKNDGGGANATINAGKIIVESGAEVWAHFGQGSIANGESATLASDIVVEAGGAFNTMDGCLRHTGNIAFNVKDAAAAAPEYDSTGVVDIYTYWDKFVNLAGLVEGAGEVQFSSGEKGSGSYLVLSNNENTFTGTYSVTTNRNNGIVLSADNAARFAGIKLDTGNGYLGVNTAAATIASLNGTSTAARVYNKYKAAASLAVSAGAFAGVIEDGSNALSLIKAGEGTLTLSGANTYSGGTSVTGGTLVAASASALGTGAVAVNGGTLTLNAGTYSLTGGLSVQTGALSIGGDATLGGGLVLGNGAGLNIGASVLTVNNTLTLGTGIALTATALENDSVLIAGITNDLGLGGEVEAATVFASITTDAGAFDLANYKIKQVGTSLVLVDKGVMDLLWDNNDEKNGGIWEADEAFTADGTAFVSNGKANVHFGEGAGSSDVVKVKGELEAGKVTIEGDYTFLSEAGGKIASATKLEVQIGSVTLDAGVLDTDVPVSLVEGTTLKWGEGNTQDYSGQLTVGGNVTLDVNGNDVILASAITGTAADKTISFASTGATAEAQNTVNIGSNVVLNKAAVNVGENVILKLNASGENTYSNVISGSGSVYLTSTVTNVTQNGVKLTGANTYSGETIFGAGATQVTNTSLSANTSGIRFADAGGIMQFVFSADYVLDKTVSGEAGKLNIWGETHTVTYSADSSAWAGSLNLYTKNSTFDLTGSLGGDIVFAGTDRTSTLKVHSALSNAIYTAQGANNAGKVIIDGGTAAAPIEWKATGKTYTGQTELAAGAYVTTAGSLTTGQNSKIVLGEGSQLTITGGLGSWTTGHSVSGTSGTLVLKTGGVITSDDATEVTGSTRNGIGELHIAGNGTVLHQNSVSLNTWESIQAGRKLIIEDGARLSMDMNAELGESQCSTVTVISGDGKEGATQGSALSSALSFDSKGRIWRVELGDDATVYVNDNVTGTIDGSLALRGYELTKTGAGILNVYLDKLVATEGDTYAVNEGTLKLNCSANKLDAYSICALDIANGASVEFCVHVDRVLTLESGLTVDGTATLNSALASTTDIASVVTGDADSTILLAKGNGATMSVSTEQTYAGTWQVGDGTADGNWSLKASHADALKSATVKLNDSDAKLVLGVDTANLAKLTGTTGTVTGSGKTLNIANSEITGVQYSGAIGEGVTIQVSEGYQKITGADRTGNVTLATLRSVEDASEEPGYDDLGGGALLLSEGEESAPVPNPVLDLAGYAHSTAEDAGVTTILAGNKGSIQNLVLGKNMLLTTQVADAVVSNASLANIGANLTLSGGKVKFHLNGSTAAEGEAFNAEVMTQYDLAGNNLVLGENTVTALTFVPEAESGKLQSKRTYLLFRNVGNLETLVDDWKKTSDASICTSAKLAAFFKTNFSENGRTSYKFAKEEWPTGTHLSLLVEGGAADLVWNKASGTWDTGTPDAEGTESWMNGSTADYFMDDDNVVFNAQKGTDAHTITIDDEDGVRIGSMKVTGDADYLFTGNAITSGEGLGNVHIGTADTATVTFENANSWKGNTNINSGAVVAKNAAALSNTTVNLNGGSLTVDGVALDATVKMLGGVLNSTAAAGGASSANVDLSAAGVDMSVNAATGTNLNLTLVGTEDVAGIIGGNVIINGEVDQEGKPVTSGAVNMTDATVVAGGSLNVATGDVTAGALVLQGAKEVTEGDTTTKIDAGAVTVKGGSLSAASLANAGGVTVDSASMSITGAVENSGIVTVDDASMSITGAVANTGSLTVTNASLTMGALDNDGTLTIGGTEMKDVQLGETTVSVPESSVVVNGDLDNTNGTIIIGSAATETEDATYGSLEVTGHLTGTGAKDDLTGTGAKASLVVEAGSLLNVEGNLSAMENVELGIGGTVIVGGNVDISTLIVAKDALLQATGADSGTSSVEIGVLGGAGTVQVDNGTLHIGALKGFTGTLAGNGTLSTDNAQFLLETKQDTTTNITGGSVLVTEAANGSSVGLVTTNEIIINTMTTDAPSLSMTGVALKDVDTVNKLSITLTQMGTTAGVDGIIQAVDAADGGIDYHLLSIAGKQSLDLFKLAEDKAVHQYLLQKGYAHSDLLSAATFAAASSTDVYISFWKQSSEESTWNVGETETEAGLIVLKDGKLLSNDVLDNVQNVVVSGTKSIDLTAAGVNDVVLNKLVGTSTSKLTIAGDGKAGDSVSIGKSSYNGTLVLDGVAADFDLTGATVVGADKDTTLSGKLTNGTLSVQQSSTAQGAGLELKDSKVQVVIGKDFTKLTKNELDQMGGVIAKLGDVTTTGSSEVAVGTTSKGIFTDSVGYDKYFDMSSARVEGGKVVADRNTVYYTSKLADSSSTDNGKAGLAMADEALLNANPQGATSTGDLAAVLDQLDAMVATGNKAAADELGASLAGASTAVLGMAAMGDVDRQLRAIRNRTTTMGVDQSVVNADMPYFNAWINAEGDSREMGDDGTLGGYKLNSYGGTVGFDVDIEPTLTAGMALTAMYGDLDATGADKATGNLDSYYVSAFARYCGSAWTHTFVGTIGMGDISLDRTVNGTQVKGETDSMSFGLMYEVGRVYAMDEDGTTCLQPVFNVTWKHTTVDAYTEKGGDVALSVDEQSLDTITFGLGARLQTVVGESMYNRTSIFECRLLAKADAGDTEGTSKVALGSSATHEVKSNEMGAIGIEVGAGLTIPLGDEGSSIFMDASAEIRADYTDVNGTVGYRVNF